MLKNIFSQLKDRGIRGFSYSALNILLSRLFGLCLTRVVSIEGNATARKIFSKRKLLYSEEGFYFLNPMPSLEELDQYYRSLYWDSRSGKNYGVNVRDLVHYTILDEHIPQALNIGKTALNFGAGHGGISNLFWLRGMTVINVEPSHMPEFYHDRWTNFESIKHVPSNSVDLLYGSHSLEHVHDLDEFKAEVARILRPGGFMFWEVPNANCPTNGAQNGHVDIPHTYYFESNFFEQWFSQTILCSGFKQCYKFNVIQNWQEYQDTKGRVIIALGRVH